MTQDLQILQEFEEWREQKLTEEPNLSVNAFIEEREAGFNVRRIEDALGILSIATNNLEQREPVRDDGEYKALFQEAVNALERAEATLVDDREYIEDCQLTDVVARRIYT